MSIINDFINLVLHLDQFLGTIIQQFGIWTYLILFLIIFAETGLVVAPFFPGDSLIFVSGALAASNLLNVGLLFVVLALAAIIGDTVNYWIGNFIGPRIFRQKNARFFKKEYLERTHDFYERHGGKTIVLARFIPVIRTFAPFVAGIGKMRYRKFLAYNVIGGIAWVSLFLLAGFYFGTLQVVKDNLSIVIIAIILISLIPAVTELIHQKRKERKKAVKVAK